MPNQLKNLFLTLTILLTLTSCSGGGSGGVASIIGVDIVVVDGYIGNAHVIDSNGNVAKYKSNGTYTFTPAPIGEITVSGGVFEDTGLPNTMTYKVSSSSRVISPITSFLHKYPHLKQKILIALGIDSTELLGDFVKSNKVEVAKLAQLMYVMNTNNLEDDFANTLTNDTDPIDIDDIFAKAKTRVTANNPTKATQIQNFLDVVKAYTGSVTDFEVAIKTDKENTHESEDESDDDSDNNDESNNDDSSDDNNSTNDDEETTQTYTITTTSNIGGDITPSSVNVDSGDATNFTISADDNYSIDTISGCGGSLSDNTFTTGVIDSNCNVNVIFNTLATPNDKIKAFPGAEGYGAYSIGGRGGEVVKVTNLNDNGPGSFREAVTLPNRHRVNPDLYVYEPEEVFIKRLDDSGHKIVVFEVSGIINLESNLNINMPYLTIAGETSPGGILITGYQTTITNHDIIIRHMRFRVGSHRISDGADPEQLDSFDILGKRWGGINTDNIIIDHCSFGWGVDETVTFSGGVTNTTIQWSVIAEGLSHAGHPKGEHSKGIMISGKYIHPNSISGHHNYIAHNTARSPMLASPADVDTRVDWVNNITYNWKGGLSQTSAGSAKVNWDNNYARQGSNSNSYSFEVILGDINSDPNPQIYVYGNIGSSRLTQDEPHWNVGNSWRNELLDEAWRRLTRWDAPQINTSIMSEAVANDILTKVGATVPVRDSADTKVIASFAARTGKIIDDVIFPDDFPTYENLPVPTDSDNDGMADNWEILNGFNVGVNDSAFDEDGDGYTNIEEYLHFLADGNKVFTTSNSTY